MASAAGSEIEIEIEGRVYRRLEVGRGPELLLLNGYGATAEDWDPAFLMALARRFRVICPDNRGMGGSDLGDPSELTIAAMATDVEALMDALELESAAVAGWSMGGYIAQALAERSPGRVSALTLIGTHGGGPSFVACEDSQPFRRLIDHSGTPREQASRLIALLFPPPQAAEIDARFGAVVAAARARLDHTALSAQERALVEWTAREPPALSAKPPTLVLHGALDELIAVGNAPVLGERWAAQVDVFAGTAHAAMAQEPLRAAAAITALAPNP